MTSTKAKEIIKNFQELALEYARKGEIDAVANINNCLAAFVEKYADVLHEEKGA